MLVATDQSRKRRKAVKPIVVSCSRPIGSADQVSQRGKALPAAPAAATASSRSSSPPAIGRTWSDCSVVGSVACLAPRSPRAK
jgi:hypothetical protein